MFRIKPPWMEVNQSIHYGTKNLNDCGILKASDIIGLVKGLLASRAKGQEIRRRFKTDKAPESPPIHSYDITSIADIVIDVSSTIGPKGKVSISSATDQSNPEHPQSATEPRLIHSRKVSSALTYSGQAKSYDLAVDFQSTLFLDNADSDRNKYLFEDQLSKPPEDSTEFPISDVATSKQIQNQRTVNI